VTLSGRERLLYSEAGLVRLRDVSRDGRVLVDHQDFRQRTFFRGEADLADRELSCLEASWLTALSRDGSLVVITESGVEAPSPFLVYLRATTGAAPTKLGTALGVGFSPDERFVVGIHQRPPAVVLYPVAGGPAKTIPLSGIVLSGAGLLPDGRTVWLCGNEPSRAARTWLTDLSGSRPRPITPEGTESWATPDGRYFVRWSDGRMWLDPTGGGEPREVRGLREGEEIAAWGPDERDFFVHRYYGTPTSVFRVDAETGSRKLVREVALADSVGVFASNLRMTPDGKAYAYHFDQVLSQLHVIEGLE
jgi:hypothetical protein